MSVRNEAKVNFLGLCAVVYLGMNRIKLYESAIKDLHEVKEKHAQEKMAVATEIAVEVSIITGIVVTLLTLAALSPSFVQAFFNVF